MKNCSSCRRSSYSVWNRSSCSLALNKGWTQYFLDFLFFSLRRIVNASSASSSESIFKLTVLQFGELWRRSVVAVTNDCRGWTPLSITWWPFCEIVRLDNEKPHSLYVYRGKLPKSYHLTLFSPPKPHYKVFRPSLIYNISWVSSVIFILFLKAFKYVSTAVSETLASGTIWATGFPNRTAGCLNRTSIWNVG
jgi:hypothetical protein